MVQCLYHIRSKIVPSSVRVWYICTIFGRIWYKCTIFVFVPNTVRQWYIFHPNMVQVCTIFGQAFYPKTADTYMVQLDSCTIFGRIWYKLVHIRFCTKYGPTHVHLASMFSAKAYALKRICLICIQSKL